MKLPSLQNLSLNVSRVWNRFPLQFFIAMASTALWWYIIEDQHLNSTAISKVLIICNFVFTLLLAADLFCEVHKTSLARKWLFRVGAIGMGFGIYFVIDPFTNKADLLRVFLIGFAFHLLVSFAPFIGKPSLNGFWQYNKTLFLRFLTSAFYAFVLFIGLAIALYAVDGLFNAEIRSETYMQLFALVSAGFSSIFFLAGVPEDFSQLEHDTSYPKGLKIFTQYVLIPLMSIYLGILLVYEVKIIIIWSLPKGIVSSLILGYAVFGILSLLLIHPIKDAPGNGWMRLFSRFFYLMMIPLVVLLILAILKRIGNYGITEPRFIIIALALWLTGITAYFLLSKHQNIKVIPISLCVFTLALIYGPQSAFSVAKSSQIKRLEKLMKSEEKPATEQLPSIVRYLVSNHGLTSLQPLIAVNLQAIESNIDARAKRRKSYQYETRTQKIDTAFSLLKINQYPKSHERETITIKNDNYGVITVEGYDAIFSFGDYINSGPKQYNSTDLKIEYLADQNGGRVKDVLLVTFDKEPPIKFDIKNIALKAYRQQQGDLLKEQLDSKGYFYGHLYPSNQLRLKGETAKYSVMLVISSMTAQYNKENNDFIFLNFEGSLLIKYKK